MPNTRALRAIARALGRQAAREGVEMKFRTKAHYERMLEANNFASVGFLLAAHMVVAARRGIVDFDADKEEVGTVARRLKVQYGETLTPKEVLVEMATE